MTKRRVGRPRLDKPKQDVLFVKIKPQFRERMDRVADVQGVNRSEFVRRAIHNEIMKTEGID